MTPKPESETDPWKAIQRYEFVQTNFAYTTDHEMERDAEGEWARWEAVDAARAAEAAQHQQALERLTRQAQDISVTLGEAGCRAMPIVDGVRWLVDHNLQLRARLAAVEEERDAFKAENGEVRRLAVKERAELAAFADRAEAERDRLKAAFLELHATVKGECPSLLDPDRGGSDVLWALCAAALTPQESTDGETR